MIELLALLFGLLKFFGFLLALALIAFIFALAIPRSQLRGFRINAGKFNANFLTEEAKDDDETDDKR